MSSYGQAINSNSRAFHFAYEISTGSSQDITSTLNRTRMWTETLPHSEMKIVRNMLRHHHKRSTNLNLKCNLSRSSKLPSLLISFLCECNHWMFSSMSKKTPLCQNYNFNFIEWKRLGFELRVLLTFTWFYLHD